jgi:cytochrome P450
MNSQNMLGVWFAASHQPWSTLTTLLLELAAREDLQVQMRKEIEDHAQLDDFKSLDNLPLLDSFMKEVVRLNPVDRGTIPRANIQEERHLIQHSWCSTQGSATIRLL